MDGLINEDGFGISSMNDLEELKKALDIGYTQPVTGTGFDALRVESLEQTLKLLTYSQAHMRLWNQIPKLEAYSTVEEYNRLVAYGSEGGGFTSSGELPQEEDSEYERADQKVKFLGTTRVVNHPATLIRSVPADLIATETQNGALWLMGKINHGLYYGDSDALPVSWNGLTKQIEDGAGHVLDLKGQPLTKENVEEAAYLIAENYGQAGGLYSNQKVFSDFSDSYNQYQRFTAPGVAPGMVGTPVTGVRTGSGDIGFQPDHFVKGDKLVPSAASSPRAPSAPTVALGTPGSATGSVFEAADAGDYKYQITAVNKYGESAPTALSAAATLAAGNGVALTITDGGGADAANGYNVYRTEKDGAITYKLDYSVARSKSGGVYTATTAWTDLNAYRPRTYLGLMLDMSPQSLSFKQLSPMIRMNLAVIAPSIRWMQLLYGTPIVYAPKKNLVFRNIGAA